MRTDTLVVVVIGSWLAATVMLAAAEEGTKQEVVQKELKKFEGTWVIASMERNRERAPKEALKGIRLIIKGDKFAIKDGNMTLEGTFKVDPSQKPKVLDATATEDGKKETTVGIYEFDGDTLKVCYTPEGGERPKEFSTKAGTNEHPIMLDVYEREKAK